MDRTSMAYWFPVIEAAGIPVPKTVMATMPPELCEGILMTLYGDKPKPNPAKHPFFSELRKLITDIGTPCFLRTAHTSAKHSWDKSCFIESADDALTHVYQIAEFSECCQLCGLPIDVWFVREMLPSITFGSCRRYGNMPVAREFRAFVENGAVKCIHPYWPLEALRNGEWSGTDEDYARLSLAGDDETRLRELAITTSLAIEGAWSVDILQTEWGWYVTDMAEANRSYHWDGCQAL